MLQPHFASAADILGDIRIYSMLNLVYFDAVQRTSKKLIFQETGEDATDASSGISPPVIVKKEPLGNANIENIHR